MIYLSILGVSDVQLWGLDAATRLTRQLGQSSTFERLELDGDGTNPSLPAGAEVLLVRAQYLFEARTLSGLVGTDASATTGADSAPGASKYRLLRCTEDQQLAAAFVAAGDVAHAARALQTQAEGSFEVIDTAQLISFDGFLRKAEAPLLKPVTADNQAELESHLYGNAYKGVTDFVTKWWWPRPARVVVGWCAKAGITPNMVTLFGLALMLAACWLFYNSYYLLGLLLGWVMTFLDTVDGKLARVTITSSKLGHVLDHGMDIVHPPFWYVFWGLSLTSVAGFTPWLGIDMPTWCALVVGAYVAGRLLEGAFHGVADCSMFAWQPFDAYSRLITARRNPCLVLLTLGVLVGQPDWGFYAVVLWSLFSSALMVVRLVQAAWTRARSGPVQSWLADPERAAREHPEAFARFSGTQGAYRTVGVNSSGER